MIQNIPGSKNISTGQSSLLALDEGRAEACMERGWAAGLIGISSISPLLFFRDVMVSLRDACLTPPL